MSVRVVVSDLVKRYRGADRNAVDGVSFTVEPGSLFSLLGPNGAGKTTTISILTTTLSATTGSVTVGGLDIAKEPSAVRRQIGIIFQQPSLDLNLTAEENIRFHAILYGLYPYRPTYRMMPAAYRKQVTDLASLLEIDEALGRPVKTFSGGMRRKLEILRSLLHRPKVLFLDEPTVGLDPASRRNLWSYLRQARREHEVTMFLTTHYLEEAEDCDDLCVIDHGRIVAQGSPAQVKASLVEDYLLIDAADRDALRQELTALGLEYSDSVPIRVRPDARGSLAIARQIQTPLTVFEARSPTLEDAYLKIVSRE